MLRKTGVAAETFELEQKNYNCAGEPERVWKSDYHEVYVVVWVRVVHGERAGDEDRLNGGDLRKRLPYFFGDGPFGLTPYFSLLSKFDKMATLGEKVVMTGDRGLG